jgi:hypothetical protein
VQGASLTAVAGAVIIVGVLLLFPVAIIMSGAVASAIIGEALHRDGVQRNEGSELLELDD